LSSPAPSWSATRASVVDARVTICCSSSAGPMRTESSVVVMLRRVVAFAASVEIIAALK
jgi:hypothetical protein